MYRLPLVNQPINQEQNKRNVLCVRYPVDHRPLWRKEETCIIHAFLSASTDCRLSWKSAFGNGTVLSRGAHHWLCIQTGQNIHVHFETSLCTARSDAANRDFTAHSSAPRKLGNPYSNSHEGCLRRGRFCCCCFYFLVCFDKQRAFQKNDQNILAGVTPSNSENLLIYFLQRLLLADRTTSFNFLLIHVSILKNEMLKIIYMIISHSLLSILNQKSHPQVIYTQHTLGTVEYILCQWIFFFHLPVL